MTISVALPPETEAMLRARAAAAGLELAEYTVRLLDEVLRKPSLDEILGPFRKQVAESGITDDELDAFFEELRDEVWRERQDVEIMSDRAVFDCMLFLQAAAKPDRVPESFQFVEVGMVTLCIADVITEIREVLNRPRLRQKFPALTAHAVNAFLVHWLERAHFVVHAPKIYDLPRDPKDEMYINLAVASGARYLVTRDCDLLDLMDDQRPEGRAFRQRFPSLRILLPETFVGDMR